MIGITYRWRIIAYLAAGVLEFPGLVRALPGPTHYGASSTDTLIFPDIFLPPASNLCSIQPGDGQFQVNL
jgi:hypothetical protein